MRNIFEAGPGLFINGWVFLLFILIMFLGKSKDGKFIVLKECDQFSDDDYEKAFSDDSSDDDYETDPTPSTVEPIFNTTLSNNNTKLH